MSSGADVMTDARTAYDASVDAGSVLVALQRAIAYMETHSSDPETYHKVVMDALRRSRDHMAACRRVDDTKLLDDRLHQFVKRHEGEMRICFSGDDVERAAAIVEHYHAAAVKSLVHIQQFQQELLIEFRALAMVAESVGDASTHGEKAARLRGLIGIIETAYEAVSKWDFDIQRSHWARESVFRSNYPVRHYLEKIRELEADVKRLSAKPASGHLEPDAEESDPFARE